MSKAYMIFSSLIYYFTPFRTTLLNIKDKNSEVNTLHMRQCSGSVLFFEKGETGPVHLHSKHLAGTIFVQLLPLQVRVEHSRCPEEEKSDSSFCPEMTHTNIDHALTRHSVLHRMFRLWGKGEVPFINHSKILC